MAPSPAGPHTGSEGAIVVERGGQVKWTAYHTHQAGETDCGPACVRTVLRRHGVLVDPAVLRESVGLAEEGSSLLRLKQVLADYHVDSALFRLDVDELRQAVTLAGPAIALLDDGGLAHYIVVHEARPDGGFSVSDPWFHRPRTMSAETMRELYSGKVLVTETPALGLTRRARWAHAWRHSIFVNEMRDNRLSVGGIIVLTLMVAALTISSSIYLQVSVDDYMRSSDVSTLTFTSLAFLAMVLGSGVFQYVRGRILVRFGQGIQRKLSERYVKKLLRLPASFYRTRRTGDLASRLDDVEGIQALLTSTAIGVSVDVAVVLIVGVYLACSNSLLFGILLSSSAIAAITSWCLYRGIRESSEEALQRDATLKSELINVVTHHEVVISHARRDYAADRVVDALGRRVDAETRLGRLDNLAAVARLLSHGSFTVAVAWTGLVQVHRGHLSLGQVLGFISLSGYFLTSLERISTLQTTLQRSSAAIGRYRDIMMQRELPVAGVAPSTTAGGGPAELRARDVAFAYPGTAHRVFDGLSVRFPAGHAVHLRGGNASGKSTLLKILAGLYPADGGNVTLGGHPVSPAASDGALPRVLYVPEIPMVVNASLWENLTLGRNHTREEVDRACVLAAATSVVGHFDNGYDEILREDAVRLSRGQLQRLALARALLVQPDVYLFDESFSGIDKDTLTTVWNALATLPSTRVLVAHRDVADLHFDTVVDLDTVKHGTLQLEEAVRE
ncbi:peptidase domain-containing ABC transporter [Streptomyces salinarius]|uniref:peptidase domain-containing ABC transporter n=1 Tax=Streptomyces salinarius TaxID=2762598 RepID=UPI0016471F4F|nr:ABC transporter transmembrane domain-containing protein [Streptomyces salinarius]